MGSGTRWPSRRQPDLYHGELWRTEEGIDGSIMRQGGRKGGEGERGGGGGEEGRRRERGGGG